MPRKKQIATFSFLLFNLFHSYLTSHGVREDHIIELSLDDRKSKPLRNPDALLAYIDERIRKDGGTYYVILDEVQSVEDFVEVLLSLMHNPQLDVYVSGSNSRFPAEIGTGKENNISQKSQRD